MGAACRQVVFVEAARQVTGLARAVGLLLALLIAACGANDAPPILRIATDATFPPFHWLDGSGAATGFDIELARELALHAGMDAEILVLPYDALFTGLVDGSHDLVAATTGITPEREEIYLFSAPYFDTCQAAVVRAGDNEPRNLVDLKSAQVGASGSGTAAAAMRSLDARSHQQIEDGEGARLLQAGDIDAWVVDEFDAVAAARESNGELGVLQMPVAVERYGLVIARDNDALKSALDQSLAALSANGRLAVLRDKYGLDRDAAWPVDCRKD